MHCCELRSKMFLYGDFKNFNNNLSLLQLRQKSAKFPVSEMNLSRVNRVSLFKLYNKIFK